MQNSDIKELYSAKQIAARLKALGAEISKDYEGSQVHCICVLKGAFMFMADLLRYISVPLTCDFLTISSYGDQTKSSGVVKFLTDLTIPIEGKHIIVVEDIVDTGLTMKYLLESLQTREPKSIKVCTFLGKPSRRKVPVNIDYQAFEIPDKFVVGYGLDIKQRYRNLSYLGYIESEKE